MFLAPHHQLVTFNGTDAQSFLQSQLTNDVKTLMVGDWQWQGYCNAKGRMHASFALVRLGNEGFGAIVPESVVPLLVKRLSMFKLRAKVAIEVNHRYAVVFHLSEPTTPAPDTLSGQGARLALGNGRWIDLIMAPLTPFPAATSVQLTAWQLRGIEARQAEILAETNEMFVPQMIGWDKIIPQPGVSFSKGCYPGQEIVARAHYRGAVKRELALMTFPNGTTVAPGADLETSHGVTAQVVNAVQHDHQWTALVVVPMTDAPATP